MYKEIKPFYLASASPRRQQLLSQMGLQFSVIKPDIDEVVLPEELADHFVARMSSEKAKAVAASLEQNSVVLAADTIVVYEQQILQKPENKTNYINVLKCLSGKKHQVKTAVSVVCADRIETCVVTTEVEFKPISQQEIEDYWETGEPQDKAGSYAIQGIGGAFVKRVEGSVSSVIGLPLCETVALLREFAVK